MSEAAALLLLLLDPFLAPLLLPSLRDEDEVGVAPGVPRGEGDADMRERLLPEGVAPV